MHSLVEPYLSKSRPALLGIGAKEQEVLGDGSKKKKRRGEEKRYIPLVRQESSGEESRNGGGTVSRKVSLSPDRAVGGMMIMMTVTLGEKVIAIGDENATVRVDRTETKMTGGEETVVEGTTTGT
ncbi:hypothetical protein DFJ58DRAFT_913926 [Suillus subalutaceus]|uniref:uncharacterized protein n=1 Tax=Suillus subalutaceus TaxID=48586 RepID=UPI001B863563|nr:uncharacterized protein DFJ58DRAFT_913926 [Suillus subalutaceus]KAG1854939.1 hypothetical protein DFJ58DRAFT_913926 [Suillus subalutaceus]